MTNLNKNELSSRTNLRNLTSTAKAGLHNAAIYPRKRYSLLALLLLGLVLCAAIYWPYRLPGALGSIFIAPVAFTFLCWVIFSLVAVGYVPGALDMQHNFARIGFLNSAGEAPYLIQKEQHGNVVTYTYRCTGFPVSLWVDKQLELESALNMLIASVKEGKDRRTVTLCCVPPEHAFDTAEWYDRYIHYNEDNLLLLGRGLTGDIIINIDKTPHILIGGNTGSGKTILLQCLLWQAIEQADVVYVADFKGGVDFPRAWQEFAYIITNEQMPNATLYHFGILMSNAHNAWVKTVCGRIKSDYRYSVNVVYNNFPWPNSTDIQVQKIESTAKAILDARALYPDWSLADLYDENFMPKELRKAHQDNDRAVMDAYGFTKGTAARTSESACVAELMKLYQQKVSAAQSK